MRKKKNKKILLLIVLILSSTILFSQETVSTAGEQLNTSQAKINFTIGEPVIYSLNSGSNTVLNGYQQPHLKIDAISIQETENWEVKVYPNPSQNFVIIDWDKSIVSKLNYELYSINGQLLKQGYSNEKVQIDISRYASGNYFLKLKNDNKNQTYKIQKIK